MLLNHQHPITDVISVTTSDVPLSVHMGDILLAETRAPLVLHEPGYPPRYYFPRLHVKMALLEKSDTSTTCPHKGKAEYFHLKSANGGTDDIAWSYPTAKLNVAEISGFISFYDGIPGLTIG